MKNQRLNRKPRLQLDPKLIRITPEEIQADLVYPASVRPRGRRQ